jgi:hypothetical protein
MKHPVMLHGWNKKRLRRVVLAQARGFRGVVTRSGLNLAFHPLDHQPSRQSNGQVVALVITLR